MITDSESEQTRLAFDAAAPVYDADYEWLPGIRRIRSITSPSAKRGPDDR